MAIFKNINFDIDIPNNLHCIMSFCSPKTNAMMKCIKATVRSSFLKYVYSQYKQSNNINLELSVLNN